MNDLMFSNFLILKQVYQIYMAFWPLTSCLSIKRDFKVNSGRPIFMFTSKDCILHNTNKGKIQNTQLTICLMLKNATILSQNDKIESKV